MTCEEHCERHETEGNTPEESAQKVFEKLEKMGLIPVEVAA